MKQSDRDNLVKQWQEEFRNALADEWEKQGHQMNGSRMESIEFEVFDAKGAMIIDVFGSKYHKYINEGVPANRIPFQPGSGKKTSLYIDALQNYAKKRMGAGEKESKSIAFAIAHKQKKEGMPTKGSFDFSTTGKRTGFIEATLEGDAVFDSLSDLFELQINLDIENLVKEGNNGNND